MHMCVCDIQTHTHTPVVLKTHTSFHFLWWMRKCSHKQINKTSIPNPITSVCFSWSFSRVFHDLTYRTAPPPILSSLSLSRLRPYLIVCLFSLAAPSFRSQAGRWEVGAQPTTHTFHPWRTRASGGSFCPLALQEALQSCFCPPALKRLLQLRPRGKQWRDVYKTGIRKVQTYVNLLAWHLTKAVQSSMCLLCVSLALTSLYLY